MRIYISGKISNLPPEQYKAHFENAEIHLKEKYKHLNIEVLNPLKLEHPKARDLEAQLTDDLSPEQKKALLEKIWAAYMEVDLGAVCNASAVYMLSNWGTSKGARCEYVLAKELGLPIEFE
jgi:hypothetical protein